MKQRHFLIQMAIPVLIAGMAILFFSCQKRVEIEKPAVGIPRADKFALAEAEYNARRYDEALRFYNMYLEESPKGEKARTGLKRIAEIQLNRHLYDDALSTYYRIVKEYPDHAEIPEVKYQIIKAYILKEDLEAANTKIYEWLRMYPDSPLAGEIMFLLGDNDRRLGNVAESFKWWQKAEEIFASQYGIDYGRERIKEGMVELIGQAQKDQLEQMADLDTAGTYSPGIFYRLTGIFLDEGDLDNAKKYAMKLVRSTTEQSWVSVGRDLIERILRGLREREKIRRGAIGCLLPLSGPYTLYGEELLNGIQLGMDIFSQSPEGREIELIIRDTKGNAEEAVALVEELVEKEKVMVIMGPLAGSPAIAAVKKAQELNVPIITFAQRDGITKAGDMVFRNFLTPSKEVEAILNRSMKEKGMRRFAIFYPANPYGNFFMNLFWDKVEEMGGEITAVESYGEDDTDFAESIKKMVGLYYPRPESIKRMLEEIKLIETEVYVMTGRMMDSNMSKSGIKPDEEEPIIDFDAVFIPDNHQHIALIAPQFPFYNIFKIPFLGTSLWQSDELLETTGEYVQDSIFPTGFYIGSDSEIVKDFVGKYREMFESDPGILAANGYDTMMFLKDLLEKSEINSRNDLRNSIMNHYLPNGVTGFISFDQSGEVEKAPVLLTVKGRRLRVMN